MYLAFTGLTQSRAKGKGWGNSEQLFACENKGSKGQMQNFIELDNPATKFSVSLWRERICPAKSAVQPLGNPIGTFDLNSLSSVCAYTPTSSNEKLLPLLLKVTSREASELLLTKSTFLTASQHTFTSTLLAFAFSFTLTIAKHPLSSPATTNPVLAFHTTSPTPCTFILCHTVFFAAFNITIPRVLKAISSLLGSSLVAMTSRLAGSLSSDLAKSVAACMKSLMPLPLREKV
eukprot:TRINITY_DN14425_c0_g1_i6.p1 TRINITY_DN14425_c0_g1~~TRINITY_DN14425_c0_g1_i6.p1  ORF type:complete len:233 (-),score=32.79 TRINITY_DN14425_c0_g1_i6:516-1214(-)